MKITRILKKLIIYMAVILFTAGLLVSFGSFVSSRKKNKNHALFNLRYFLFKSFNSDIYGVWSNPVNQTSSLFINSKGNAETRLVGDSEKFAKSLFTEGIKGVEVRLHEKFKVSSSNLSFFLVNPRYDKQDEILYFPEQIVHVRYLKSSSRFFSKECLMDAKASMASGLGFPSFFKLEMSSITCPEVNIVVKADPISTDIKTIEVLFHLAFCYIFIALQVYFIAKLDSNLSNNLQQSNQISLISVLLLSTFQLFNGFEQLIYSVFNFPYWGVIVLIGVAFFNLFFFMILKLMTTILKNQISYRVGVNPEFPLRQHLLLVYMMAHSTILLSFYLCLEYSDKPILYLGWTFALLPQIIKNFFCKTRFLGSMKNLSGLYVCLILFGLYQHFFKYNFFYVHMNNNFDEYYASRIVFAMLIMVFILIWQETCNPHMIFSKFRSDGNQFQYLKSLKEISEEKKIDIADTDCIICLVNLETIIDSNEWEAGMDNEQLVEYIKDNKDKQLMVTPCEHYYHTSCLMAWMSMKMECPCCRQSLPPIV
jgi:hypothetical protein